MAIIGQEKGSDTKSRLKHNFGMARPEGYRKAVRIMDLAERFQIPAVALWCPAQLTNHEPLPPQPPRHVLDEHAGVRLAALLDGRTSRCTRLTPTDWGRLLPHAKPPRQAGSCALARLTLGEPMGYLVLASPDPDHFRASMDTLFTEYLGDVLARLLLRHAPSVHDSPPAHG